MRLLLFLAATLSLSAAQLTITYTGTGSGSLNGLNFVDQPFNILAIADTSNILVDETFARIQHTSANIEFGGGVWDFTVPTSTVFLFNSNNVRFAFGNSLTALYQNFLGLNLADYNFDSLLVIDDPSTFLLQWTDPFEVTTSGGRLIFNEGDTSGQFTIAPSGDGPPPTPTNPVPEPSTIALVAIPLLALLKMKRR